MNFERFRKKPFFLNDEDIDWMKKTYLSMTLNERIGQLFFLTAYGTTEEYYSNLVDNYSFGGLMFRPLETEEIYNGVTICQSRAKVPLLISANLEAGANGFSKSGTKVGNQMMVAATGDSRYAYLLGKVAACEAKSLGLNYTFSPVADIDYNFRNPITNTRTFGSDAENVLEMSRRYVKACNEENVATAVKHFPGDGIDERDQHLVTTYNRMTKEQWDATYGKVYSELIEAGTKTIMVGHICLPAYERYFNPSLTDEELVPACLSVELLRDLLRGQLGFNGLIITDATTMAGLNMAMSRDMLVPMCIECGCDMFLFTRNLDEDYRFMREGYDKGILSEGRLEEAVYNILALKASLGLHKDRRLPDKKISAEAQGTERNRSIALEVADKSITLVKEQSGVLPLTPEKYRRVLLHVIDSGENALGYDRSGNGEFVGLLESEGFEVDVYTPGENRYEGMQTPYEDTVKRYDLIIYICSVATKSNQTTVRIEWTNPMGMNVPIYVYDVPTIFISTENPYHMLDVPNIPTFINTYGKNQFTLKLLVDKLMGRSEFKGKSPVDPYCGLEEAKYQYYDRRKAIWKESE